MHPAARLNRKPEIKEFHKATEPSYIFFPPLFQLSYFFHNKPDIFFQKSWDTSRVLLICSHLAVPQLAHYGDRLLMKVKAGCRDNYSYRQISCCSESITMSFGCDGDFL